MRFKTPNTNYGFCFSGHTEKSHCYNLESCYASVTETPLSWRTWGNSSNIWSTETGTYLANEEPDLSIQDKKQMD